MVGQTKTKQDAVAAVEHAIDKALARKQLRCLEANSHCHLLSKRQEKTLYSKTFRTFAFQHFLAPHYLSLRCEALDRSSW
jgi:hypothetical protein